MEATLFGLIDRQWTDVRFKLEKRLGPCSCTQFSEAVLGTVFEKPPEGQFEVKSRMRMNHGQTEYIHYILGSHGCV